MSPAMTKEATVIPIIPAPYIGWVKQKNKFSLMNRKNGNRRGLSHQVAILHLYKK